MPNQLETWQDWLGLIVYLAITAGLLWASARIANATRGVTDLQLAAKNATQQRRLQEFTLYTRTQHRVDPRLWAKSQRAGLLLAHMVSDVEVSPTALSSVAHLNSELARGGLGAGPDAERIRDAFTRGDREQAAMLLEALRRSSLLPHADRERALANNYVALHELFLSDAVRNRAKVLLAALESLSAELRSSDPARRGHRFEKSGALNHALGELFLTMRSELQRGAAEPVD